MSETRGFAELIPYMTLLTDQIAICKDSGLLATYEIAGKDIDSISESEIDALLSNIETALYPLRLAPWKVWFRLKRFETDAYPGGFETQPGSMAWKINENHKEQFNGHANYATKAYLSFFLSPHSTSSRYTVYDRLTMMIKRTGMMLGDGEGFFTALKTGFKAAFTSQYAFAYQAHELAYQAQDFEKTIEGCESNLSVVGLRRLRGEEFLGFLRSTVSGYATPDQPTSLSSNSDWFLDSFLSDSLMEVHRDHIRLGDKLVSALSMKEWPAGTDPRLVPTLMGVNSELTFSCAFNFLSHEESKSFISGVKGYANLVKFKLKDYVTTAFGGRLSDDRANRYAMEMIEDSKDAEFDVDSGRVAFGFMNLTLLMEQKIHGNDDQALEVAQSELNRSTTTMRRHLSTLYPGVIREDLHLLGAWCGTLPGQWKEPVRWSFMSSGNLADSAPVLLVNEGERINEHLTKQTGRERPALTVMATPYNTPFYFNFHQGALAHAMVVGPSRAGKSVLMNFLISQWSKYDPCRAIIFDKDYSCRINTLMHDGDYFDLNQESEVRLNPIALVDDKANWEFLSEWIGNLISFNGHKITSEDEVDIYKAIEFVSLLHDPKDKRLFSISNHLPERLRVHLSSYVDGGPLAHYFDNEVDDFTLSSITAFEMGELLANKKVAVAFIDYAFYRIMKTIRESHKPGNPIIPTLIYLEECWFLFEVEEFKAKVRDLLKTLAKLDAFVVLTTQSMEDMASSDAKFFASIRDNIPTRIFLPNAKAKTDALRNLYINGFGLEESYVDLIQMGIPKRDYLIVTDEYAKQVQCQFGESTLAVLRSDSVAQATFNKHYKKTPDWKNRYIYEMVGEDYDKALELREKEELLNQESYSESGEKVA